MAKHIPDPIDAGCVADKICCRPVRSQTTRRGVDKSRKNDEEVPTAFKKNIYHFPFSIFHL
jgi:hypothetical protein